MSFFDIDIIIDNDLRKSFVASNQTKVELLKKKINKNVENVEFLFKGDILENDKCLNDYNIIHESIIYCFTISKSELSLYNVGSTNAIGNILDIFSQLLNQNMAQPQDYSEHMITLNNMGFYDNDQNQLLLNLYQGDIELVMTYLLGY
jgi:hypothetical protein